MTPMRICSVLWTLLWVVWMIAWLRTKPTQERARFGSRLGYGIPVLAAFYLLFGDQIQVAWLHLRIIPHNLYVGGLGVAITGMGIALAIWARFYLGENWSSAVSIKVGHQLIRSGPYAWVRHPIYSGLLLGAMGTGLVLGEVRGVLAIILLWYAFSVKRRMEEVFMRKTFGADYEAYTASTGALVPRVRM